MIRTYGQMPAKPEGMFVAVRFPVLAVMDKTTGDHRRLSSAGAGARETPSGSWSISAQFEKSYGHDGAVLSGALYEITFDDSTGIVSGRGYMADDENGRRHAWAIKTGMMAGNSISLAEVSAQYVEDFDTGEWWIDFTKWNLADTSGVMTPAFYEAYAVIDDEITAAMDAWDLDEELVASVTDWEIHVPEPDQELAELLASASAPVQKYEDFFRPEAAEPTKIVVTADGKVYGHVCLWDSFHASMAGNVRPPRPTDGYRSFNKPGVLTEKGIVPTGPIFAYRGHKRGEDLNEAYGGIENAWCDVRVTEGMWGPWVSGVVRPGVTEETVYAARASRISGHWVKGALKAIVSVNAEGYEVEGPDAEVVDIAAGYAWRTEGDEVVELVASLDVRDIPQADPNHWSSWRGTGGAGHGDGGTVTYVFSGLPSTTTPDAQASAIVKSMGATATAVTSPDDEGGEATGPEFVDVSGLLMRLAVED